MLYSVRFMTLNINAPSAIYNIFCTVFLLHYLHCFLTRVQAGAVLMPRGIINYKDESSAL